MSETDRLRKDIARINSINKSAGGKSKDGSSNVRRFNQDIDLPWVLGPIPMSDVEEEAMKKAEEEKKKKGS